MELKTKKEVVYENIKIAFSQSSCPSNSYNLKTRKMKSYFTFYIAMVKFIANYC